MLSFDTNSLRHLPRRSIKNCDLEFANNDRQTYLRIIVVSMKVTLMSFWHSLCYPAVCIRMNIASVVLLPGINPNLAFVNFRELSHIFVDLYFEGVCEAR